MKTITAIGIIAVLGIAVYFVYKTLSGKATTTTKTTTTIPHEYKPAYTPAVQPKKIVRFVPPPPPPVVSSWAVNGYWEMGYEGSLLAPITPAMAFNPLYAKSIPNYVIAWYKANYPQYESEV